MGTLAEAPALDRALLQVAGERVYFDTNVLIYAFEFIAPFHSVAAQFVTAAETGHLDGVTGEMALSELLVKPFRDGNVALMEDYREFFDEDKTIVLLPHHRAEFELMAQLRGVQGLRAADALHVATAIRQRCRYFLTADSALAKRITGVTAIDLNTLVSDQP